MLGWMRIEGSRGLFPMLSMTARRLTAPRLALVGEAAHVLPRSARRDSTSACAMWPASSTGCSLRARSASISAVRSRWPPTNLAAAAMCCRRVAAIDALNRSLLEDLLPVDLLRGAGLLALATIGPLRRALMRAGVTQTSKRAATDACLTSDERLCDRRTGAALAGRLGYAVQVQDNSLRHRIWGLPFSLAACSGPCR